MLAFSFDEAGGDAIDSSPSGLRGVVSGAVRVPGRVGRALPFDGSDDIVTVADAPLLDLTTAVTLEAWVNPSELDGWKVALLKESVDGLSYTLYADDGAPFSSTHNPAGYVHLLDNDRRVRGANRLPLNTWSHLVMSYDGSEMRIYVNGALAGSRAESGRIGTSDGPLGIGGIIGCACQFFAGLIDEVRIYNRALTAEEVAGRFGAAGPTP